MVTKYLRNERGKGEKGKNTSKGGSWVYSGAQEGWPKPRAGWEEGGWEEPSVGITPWLWNSFDRVIAYLGFNFCRTVQCFSGDFSDR